MPPLTKSLYEVLFVNLKTGDCAEILMGKSSIEALSGISTIQILNITRRK